MKAASLANAEWPRRVSLPSSCCGNKAKHVMNATARMGLSSVNMVFIPVQENVQSWFSTSPCLESKLVPPDGSNHLPSCKQGFRSKFTDDNSEFATSILEARVGQCRVLSQHVQRNLFLVGNLKLH